MSTQATTQIEPFDDSDGLQIASEEQTGAQYVTFHVGNECFGFHMSKVLEIIRVPDVVKVPVAPPALRGLANLRGSILPVIDLRRTLGLKDRELDDASRAIVIDCGRPVGLVVDRVAMVLEISDNDIEDAASVQSTINADVLNGIAKNVAGQDLIQVFDAQALIDLEFDSILSETSDQSALASSISSPGIGSAEESIENEDLKQMVSFIVNKQEYAFELAEVHEIVRVPESISSVPRCDHSVLGLINLRSKLLPLVSLRRVFSMTDQNLGENHRVIVVSFDARDGVKRTVGVVVDKVNEVLRLGAQNIDPLPNILERGLGSSVDGICRLEDGKRLVSILSSTSMWGDRNLQEAIAQADKVAATKNLEGDAADNSEEDMTELQDNSERSETQLVVFQLAGQNYGVPIDVVEEIIRVPDQMNSMPKTPAFVRGVVNLRGTVLPVIEMRLKFELESIENNDRQRILVLQVNNFRAGFVVDAVSEVLRLARADVDEAPAMSSEQKRLMGQIANVDNGKRMIQIVSVDELLGESELDALHASASN